MENYGIRIRNRRIELGMSQQELADRLGYTDRSTIAKIETGKNDISLNKFKELADALQIAPAKLLGWEDDDNGSAE